MAEENKWQNLKEEYLNLWNHSEKVYNTLVVKELIRAANAELERTGADNVVEDLKGNKFGPNRLSAEEMMVTLKDMNFVYPPNAGVSEPEEFFGPDLSEPLTSVWKEQVEDNIALMNDYLDFDTDEPKLTEEEVNIIKSSGANYLIEDVFVEEPVEKDPRSINEIIADKDTKALNKHLSEGMNHWFDNPENVKNYAKFLDFASKFSRYSYRNQKLIHAQAPTANFVASFKNWKEKHDNPIKKGAKSIKIWAPFKYVKKDKEGQPKKDENGNVIKEQGFKLVSVFDESQTQDPTKIPSLIQSLKGDFNPDDPKKFGKTMQAISSLTTAKITIDDFEQNAKGFYQPGDNTIHIKQGMGQNQTIKTTLHEVAHSRLHQDDRNKFGDKSYAKNEFEAESLAYIVAAHIGLDTSEYTFGYLRNWTENGQSLEDLDKSLQKITAEANTMISQLDEKLEALEQNTDTKSNVFSEILNPAKAEIETGSKDTQTENLTRKVAPKR